MLELKNIKKTYESKDLKVKALKGISIKFRKNEFVSILGPSGCGKTTLLNIVGGLDQYTSGDLIINGKSTKEFKDRDWDSYRNHTIGFVFQSYNLIPHQTVLQNVELALTLSGISKQERKKRATDALKKVGLADKLNSRPNQLSGGQMQRVAIARALVNDPDVVLADEPTGALDSKTSVQVMELLKQISDEKLVIMVTHNPELANAYSTRIIKLLDGELEGDSNPCLLQQDDSLDDPNLKQKPQLSVEKDKKLKNKYKLKKSKTPKTTMSFFTALSLSFKNLLTKKARTILVAVAGSIGIIGIALILALSTGFQTYVNKVQEDTLYGYPVTISAVSVDPTQMIMSMFASDKNSNHDNDAVYAGDTMTGIFEEASKQVSKINDLESFVKYLEANKADLSDYVTDIQYTYSIGYAVKDVVGNGIAPTSDALYRMVLMYSCNYVSNSMKIDMVVVRQENGMDIYELQQKATTQEDINANIGFLFAYLPEAIRTEKVDEFTNYGKTELTETQLVNTIFGSIFGNQKDQIINICANSTMPFNEMIDNKELLQSQYDVVSGKWADTENEIMLVLGNNNELDDYVLYGLGLISEQQMKDYLSGVVTETASQIKLKYDDIIGKEYKILLRNDFYFKDTENGDVWVNWGLWKDSTDSSTIQKYNQKYSELLNNSNAGKNVKICGIVRLKQDQTSGLLKTGLAYTKQLTNAMIEYHNNSEVAQSGALAKISSTPETINFYATSFESRNKIEDFINKYNTTVAKEQQIDYSDTLGTMMGSISTIINAITYVLIAFVSVSLVVSSIMIGIITYISVLERIKEIGILRSVGASKRDIKRVFTAETLIIGFTAGLLGVLITLLLTIPLNIIIKKVAGIAINASLPVVAIFILIAISMVLTFIAGLIPSNIASKKDPVVALRSD